MKPVRKPQRDPQPVPKCDTLHHLRHAAFALGATLEEPFLQLAFLPLPVIPHLKISDRGLVDVDKFMLIG